MTLHLHVETLGAVTALVLDGRAGIGISGPMDRTIDGIDRRGAGGVTLCPVAAPGHPLARGPLPPGAGRDHVQLVLSDRSPLTAGRDFSVISPRTWRLADLGAKHALLREAIGWGFMPLSLVAEDLASGALVRLAMPDQPDVPLPFDAIWRRDAPPGPAARWLLDHFTGQADASNEI